MPNRKIYWRLFLSALLVSILGLTASFAGKWLVVDCPRHSDVIVVLTGDFGDIRFQHALKLLRGGYARELFYDAPDWIHYGRTDADLARTYVQAIASDQAGHIHVCSFHEDSTVDELREVAPCIRAVAPHAATAIVVTSNFHTRRALSIVRHTLPQYQWSVAAVPSPFFFGTPWWHKREWIKTTLIEWQKSCWWFLVERWSTRR
jgi:uncharacterized SAM-binding protein YcdF (DUF218 family)